MPDTPHLRVRDLIVAGDDGRQILRVARLDIAPGSKIGIRGPSGAGKSTLLNAMAGLIDRMSGEVCWGDINLNGLTPKARSTFRSRHIGMIFQDFLLFDELSPATNASIAALYAPKAARKALQDRAMSELSRRNVPATHRTVSSFSGGERQRVAVARALAHDPQIVLADEPTASLDPATGDAMISDLTDLTRTSDKTLIVVSHDDRLLSRMDQIVTVSDGTLTTGRSAA